MIATEKCMRCHRLLPGDQEEDWNVEHIMGVYIGVICPSCQTPEEDAQAKVDEVIKDYSNTHRCVFDPMDKNDLKRETSQLMAQYKTPEALRLQADRLEAASDSDAARLMVIVARHTAKSMERQIEERKGERP